MISAGAVTTPPSPKFQTIIYLPKGSLPWAPHREQRGTRSSVLRSLPLPSLDPHAQEFPPLYVANFRPAQRKNQYLWHGVNYPHQIPIGGLFRWQVSDSVRCRPRYSRFTGVHRRSKSNFDRYRSACRVPRNRGKVMEVNRHDSPG